MINLSMMPPNIKASDEIIIHEIIIHEIIIHEIIIHEITFLARIIDDASGTALHRTVPLRTVLHRVLPSSSVPQEASPSIYGTEGI